MQVAVIVPAAGMGKRFGGCTSKLLVPLQGKPLLMQTLSALQRWRAARWIVVVVRERELTQVSTLLRRYRITKALAPVAGGSSRAESVARGFAALPRGAQWVVVHDGARPCVSDALLRRVARAAQHAGAAICGLPAALTVKSVDPRGYVRATMNRDSLRLIQTPQMFRYDWFARALKKVNRRWRRFPDDAAIVEAAGFPVRVVMGDPRNIKVTTKDDVILARALLKR